MKFTKLTILGAIVIATMGTAQHSYSQTGSERLSASSNSQKVIIEKAQRGVAAKLDDQNDYYFLPNGAKQKLYRKKDVYVVRTKANARARSAADTMRRFKGQFGDRVKSVSKHQFGSATVVRIDNRSGAKTKSKRAFEIKPEMLSALDSSTSELSPIFTTANGQDDLLLLPKVTLELNASVPEQEALAKLKQKYGLNLVRKLKLSADVYSLAFSKSNIAPRSQFAHVRKLMNEPFVTWAEPQFYFKPIKNQFTPNDTLFNQQWNLRNRGYQGSRCDTDCDADNAWGLTSGSGSATGAGMVIAIVDDGVQLNHPDLNVDTVNDKDFVDDSNPSACFNSNPPQTTSDGNPGPDNDASPRATANCFLAGQGEPLEEDSHGTAVAGIAAAVGNNGTGIAGVAYGAQILPIRAISDFDEVPFSANDEAFCDIIAEAMEYAAQHADVINNSWSLPITCGALETALADVTAGTVTGAKRPGKGSPVIFASGNDASGWVKVTIPVTAGEHAYEWRLLRGDFPTDFIGDDDTVWLDDIVWPDGTNEGFEVSDPGLSEFTNRWAFDSCNDFCDSSDVPEKPIWKAETNTDFVRSGSRSAKVDAFINGTSENSFCGNSYLHTIKDGPAGTISFWVWVSTDTSAFIEDRFEFLIDGKEVLSYGDLGSFGFVDNDVAYPALLSGTNAGVIAVGASKSGDLSGVTTNSLTIEERASYSQFGPTLDLVAPSSDQHLGITTTDRTGTDGYSGGSYTSNFGGTSAAAPVVAGVAAAMLATDPNLTAAQVKTMLRSSADKIGPVAYSGGRNDYHGYGRVNMYNALRTAAGQSTSQQPAGCSAQSFSYSPANDLLLPRYKPQPTEFCPARGPLPVSDDLCVPIIASNGKIALICL